MDLYAAVTLSSWLIGTALGTGAAAAALALMAQRARGPISPRCPSCGFDLRGLPSPSAPCSECGDTRVQVRQVSRRARLLSVGAALSTALSLAALAWLAADPGCRARVVSWALPWEQVNAWPIGDAEVVIEKLRFAEPYPEDGIAERAHICTPRGSITLGEAHVWEVQRLELGDGIHRLAVDLVSGGSGGFGGTWMVTVPADAPPSAAMLGERAQVLPWPALRAQHEEFEVHALGAALPRSHSPQGMALAVASFQLLYLFTNRADTPSLEITGSWDGQRWVMGCAGCADAIDDAAFAAIANHVDARMLKDAAARPAPDGRPREGARAVKPLLDAVAALAQAGLRERALELARLLFSPGLGGYIGDATTPEEFAREWSRALDADDVQQVAQTPSSRSALSTARTGEPSKPSSGSGSATSSH